MHHCNGHREKTVLFHSYLHGQGIIGRKEIECGNLGSDHAASEFAKVLLWGGGDEYE